MDETPADPADDERDTDVDAWRDDVSIITPSRAGAWLALPIAYFCIGAGYLALLMVLWSGRTLNGIAWAAVAGCLIFMVWAVVLAVLGRRTAELYELAVSQQYQRVVVAGEGYLCVVVLTVGLVTSAVGLVFLGVFGLVMSRLFRRRFTSLAHATAFRRSILVLQDQVLYVAAFVLIAGSLATGLVVTLVVSVSPSTQSSYVNHGIVGLVWGVAALIFAVIESRRLSASGRLPVLGGDS